jgi:membrane fusion protein (multidrug efflux system)
MWKRMIVMLAVLGAVFAGLNAFVGFRAGIIKNVLAGLSDPDETVSAAAATEAEWQASIKAIGTFRAVNGADLALEASGIVDKILARSGDDVLVGQPLVELRRDEDLAKLASLQATADGFAITLKRDQGQLKVNAVSQATVDADLVNQKNALAQVAQQQAVVNQKILKAPFAGRLGLRSVDEGQYLSAGTTVFTLQALDSLYLDFNLPQKAINQVKVGQHVEASVDAFPGETFGGVIQALNAKVDSTSRNVQVRALFDNVDRRLAPGMYATLDVAIDRPKAFVTLPQTAIVFNPYGDSLFLAVKDETGKLKARQIFVKTGARRGDQIAVMSGVDVGAMVVTAGQIKLHNGSKVIIDNSLAVPDEASPEIADQQ